MGAIEEVDIVGGDEFEAEIGADAGQGLVTFNLGFETVVVDFQKKVFGSENFAVLASDPQGIGVVIGEDCRIDFPEEAST